MTACLGQCLVVAAALAVLHGCESRGSLLGDGAGRLDALRGEEHIDLPVRDRKAESRPPLPDGQSCLLDGQCRSGHCSDGVCCAVACGPPCSRCNRAGFEGTCLPVAEDGSPPPGKDCATSPVSTCGLDGTCDGRGSCRRWPAGTVCRSAQCEASVHPTILSLAWQCDGAGSCVALGELECAPYGCDAAQLRCFSSCSGAASLSCEADAICDAQGRCDGALPPLGAPCSSGSGCASGKCVDGVCCESDCSGACESCALSGSAGRCAAIAAGLPPKPGKSCPVDPLQPCGNDGKCDGHHHCRPAPPGTVCGGASCQKGTVTLRVCNGDPSSPACTSKEISCGAFLCQPGGAGCYLSCTSAAQCREGSACSDGRCGD